MPRKRSSEHLTVSKEQRVLALLATQLRRHSTLSDEDENALQALTPETLKVPKGEDIVRQGDKPAASIFILTGMLGRYHTTASGSRQYLSLHISGDLPDLQSLFLVEMDHGLSALDEVEIACLPHRQLRTVMLASPALTFAFWRETLLDAAIFRQAITTNGARSAVERVAHLLCEQYARARLSKINVGTSCSFPLNQTQIGQTLGLSIVTVNRAMQALRKKKCADVREGKLLVYDWKQLQKQGSFDPTYLHAALHAGPFEDKSA